MRRVAPVSDMRSKLVHTKRTLPSKEKALDAIRRDLIDDSSR